MRAMDNGHLTKADRATLQQQQNQVSSQIYKDKHNTAVQNTTQKTESTSERNTSRTALVRASRAAS